MRTLIVVDDSKSLLDEHLSKFNEIFSSPSEYKIVEKEVQNGMLKSSIINDLSQTISEELKKDSKVVLVVDYDFKLASANYNGKDVLDEINRLFQKEIDADKLFCILTSAIAFFDGGNHVVIRRSVSETNDTKIFDRNASSPGLYRNFIKTDEFKRINVLYRNQIETLLNSGTMYGDYFGYIFAFLLT